MLALHLALSPWVSVHAFELIEGHALSCSWIFIFFQKSLCLDDEEESAGSSSMTELTESSNSNDTDDDTDDDVEMEPVVETPNSSKSNNSADGKEKTKPTPVAKVPVISPIKIKQTSSNKSMQRMLQIKKHAEQKFRRRRGRPPKSSFGEDNNMKSLESKTEKTDRLGGVGSAGGVNAGGICKPVRGRGRPPGSKNKPRLFPLTHLEQSKDIKSAKSVVDVSSLLDDRMEVETTATTTARSNSVQGTKRDRHEEIPSSTGARSSSADARTSSTGARSSSTDARTSSTDARSSSTDARSRAIWRIPESSRHLLDKICITDVTCNAFTVTVRESSTQDGFFKNPINDSGESSCNVVGPAPPPSWLFRSFQSMFVCGHQANVCTCMFSDFARFTLGSRNLFF